MEKAAILHIPFSSYAYSYNKNTLHLKLRCKKDDLKTVTLVANDPYLYSRSTWKSKQYKMEKIASTNIFDYYFYEISILTRRLMYGFILEDKKEEKYFYGSRNFSRITKNLPNRVDYYFKFPFIHNKDMFLAPKWVKNTIWYQIFPERFACGDQSISPSNALAWNSAKPSAKNYFGGDLLGILNNLDYLSDLGINGIYLNPIFEASSNHKYDTIDYFKIDPHFGDKETFRALVKKAHKLGIKIMLDGVFNHIGINSKQWQDVLQNKNASNYFNWFHVHSISEVKNDLQITYDTFAFAKNLPKLNTENPEVIKYLIKVGTYWIKEFDIDGWRLDVANEVDHAFWKKFSEKMRKVKPDVYLVGEVWHDATPWLYGDEFDGVMNYPVANIILDCFIHNSLSGEHLVFELTEELLRYPKQVTMTQFNLLDSHDTPRLLTLANGDKRKVKQALLFLFLLPGSPCLYYGTEIGMTGGDDPNNRKCMVWEEDKQDKEMLLFIKSIIAFRKKWISLICEGKLEWLKTSVSQNSLGAKITKEKSSLYFFFNLTDQKLEIPLKEVGNRSFEIVFGEFANFLEPYGFLVLKQ